MVNSVDPDETSRPIWIYTVCTSIDFGLPGRKGYVSTSYVYTFWMEVFDVEINAINVQIICHTKRVFEFMSSSEFQILNPNSLIRVVDFLISNSAVIIS